MFLEYEEDPGDTFDSKGTSIEIGAAYIISPNWNASIGYKYQQFTGDFNGTDLTDTFSGFTIGANYRF
jgi:opacity protein-like surface antigen